MGLHAAAGKYTTPPTHLNEQRPTIASTSDNGWRWVLKNGIIHVETCQKPKQHIEKWVEHVKKQTKHIETQKNTLETKKTRQKPKRHVENQTDTSKTKKTRRKQKNTCQNMWKRAEKKGKQRSAYSPRKVGYMDQS